MASWIINFITSLAQLLMICAIIFLIGYGSYLIYKKREQNQTLPVETQATGLVKNLARFAAFIANKIKK